MSILGVLLGILGHQSHHLFNEWERDGVEAWHRLGRYSVGMGCVAIALRQSLPIEDRERVMGQFWRVSVSVGMGVSFAYAVLDRLRDEGK